MNLRNLCEEVVREFDEESEAKEIIKQNHPLIFAEKERAATLARILLAVIEQAEKVREALKDDKVSLDDMQYVDAEFRRVVLAAMGERP